MPRPPRRSGRVQLRRVGPRDLDLLGDHRRRMWEDIGSFTRRALDEHEPRYRAWLGRALGAGRVVGLVAETADGEAVASGLVWFQESQPRPGEPADRSPYILSMYTAPGHRGRGLASRIVRGLVAECRARGCVRVTLHASVQGRPVYRRLGFERGWEMRRFLGRRPGRRPASARRR